MQEPNRDQRNSRFVRFWFREQRVITAFALGVIPAVVVYNLTGWAIVSFVTGALLAVGVLVLMATYAPRQ